MSLIPRKKTEKVSFFNSKITPWSANATAIGTSSAEVTALQTKVTAAQAALAAQVAAEAAAKTATDAADAAVDELTVAGSEIIKAIRAQAARDGNTVYTLAELPFPTTPTPVNTLGLPSNFRVELGQDGSVILTWKCANPRASGAVYQVWRRVGGAGDFAYLGGVGAKKFVDTTLPTGTNQATYQIQAVRSTAIGPWAQFNVNFGTGGGVATVTEGTAVKIAA